MDLRRVLHAWAASESDATTHNTTYNLGPGVRNLFTKRGQVQQLQTQPNRYRSAAYRQAQLRRQMDRVFFHIDLLFFKGCIFSCCFSKIVSLKENAFIFAFRTN